jgi:hypothetical protein
MPERPFHVGDREAQRRAGLEAPPAGAGIRDFMPDQHRLFFAQLPFVVAATLDEGGAPAATVLTGQPGFLTSPAPRTLAVAARSGDPAGGRMTPGAPIGLLGIELPTRRRNRLNGRIATGDETGFHVEVAQSFGNCPQHIHPRAVALVEPGETCAREFEGLDAEARATISQADTFFVATSSGEGIENGGVDVSHRGGWAGFVAMDGSALTIPDFRGNRYFNTLGNLLLEPRAALLFLDLDTGVLTQLQGRAEVLWDRDEAHGGGPAAERSWRFTAERGWRRRIGLRRVAAHSAVQPPSTESAAPVVDAPMSETR